MNHTHESNHMSQIEIPDPSGYKVVAYREPKNGELHLRPGGGVEIASDDYAYCYPIVERVEVWRDATIDDLKRAPCKARFRNYVHHEWLEGVLAGYVTPKLTSEPWISSNINRFKFCQVIDQKSPVDIVENSSR